MINSAYLLMKERGTCAAQCSLLQSYILNLEEASPELPENVNFVAKFSEPRTRL